MNVEPIHQPLPGQTNVSESRSLDLALSAMVDGEIDSTDLGTLLNSLEPETLSSWHTYHVIGDVLRGQAAPLGATPAVDFLAAVRKGMATSETQGEAATRWVVQAADSSPVAGRGEAANDEVFRWKLVAGFASLAAVMAVSWGVISGSGSVGPAGAQLAATVPDASTPAVVARVASPAVSAPVAVNTGQGVVIRDAQLEALVAEHRQHGGMSALQMPSGFIRNATYEASGR